MRSRIVYIELKTGFNDNGPARIGRVSFSRTLQTTYYGTVASARKASSTSTKVEAVATPRAARTAQLCRSRMSRDAFRPPSGGHRAG
jgi:hypothetical protein